MTKTNENNDVPSWHLWLVYIPIVLCMWLGSWFVIEWILEHFVVDIADDRNLITTRGQFGDSFGAVNALFSGLAFAILIFTIRQQKKEIQQTQALIEQQNKEFEFQRLESTLFSYLRMHQEVLDSIEKEYKESDVKRGKNAIGLIYKEFKHDCNSKTNKEIVTRYSESTYETYSPFLGPYFRTLYRCFKYIEDNEEKVPDAFHYAKMIRAQISEAEMVLIFYNAQTDLGKNFKNIIEKYALFDNFSPNEVLGKKEEKLDTIKVFSERAWGRNYQELAQKVE